MLELLHGGGIIGRGCRSESNTRGEIVQLRRQEVVQGVHGHFLSATGRRGAHGNLIALGLRLPAQRFRAIFELLIPVPVARSPILTAHWSLPP